MYSKKPNGMKKEFLSESAVRLNKYLAQAGICSRREADQWIEAGRVTVDGKVGQAGQKVEPDQCVQVDGKDIRQEETRILLAFYKPRGVVCTTDKRWGDTTVEEVVNYPKRVFYAGRLDKDSEGLLLLTNDGDLQNQMMRAANAHEKEYLVEVDTVVDDLFLKKMAAGVYLKELDVTTRPCQIEKTGKKRFRIVLTQGLNRQIRRMCETCGKKVVRLKRVRIMNIQLGNLACGAYREVTEEEMRQLLKMLKREDI